MNVWAGKLRKGGKDSRPLSFLKLDPDDMIDAFKKMRETALDMIYYGRWE
jgi:hypothetical protein